MGLKQRWPVILLVVLLSLFPAIAVIRTAMVYAFAPAFPEVAGRFSPDHPRVVMGRVEQALEDGMGLVNGETKSAARQALRRAPMLEEPMLLAGIDRLVTNDDQQAKQFLTHALARNPRSELTRLLMLEVDLRTGDVQRAVSDMTILGRLLPNSQTVFVPELARMARDPRTSRTLAPTLRSDPIMLAGVLRYLAENGASPRLVLELAGAVPIAPPGRDIPDWREPLLRAMVGRGDFAGAKRLWTAFAGIKQEPRGEAIYDQRFRGLPGLPPFNWALSSSEIGAAEPDRSGGLQVEYYGRTPGELAAQLVVLAPGRYRLAFRAEGEIKDPQHRLFWKVQCPGKDGAVLAEIPIANISYAGRTIAGDFSIPADCPAQWLRLVGQPTEFPKIESVVIREVRIQGLTGQS